MSTNDHCVKSAQIRFFFSGPYFPVVSPNAGKYGPEKSPHLDTFHAVDVIKSIKTLSSMANASVKSC